MSVRNYIDLIEENNFALQNIEIDTGYDDETDETEPRHGDTVARINDLDEIGRLSWFVQDGEVHIESIETSVSIPLLSIKMIDSMVALTKLPIDPGMMNADGRRLWDLYRRRRNV